MVQLLPPPPISIATRVKSLDFKLAVPRSAKQHVDSWRPVLVAAPTSCGRRFDLEAGRIRNLSELKLPKVQVWDAV
jgi:hypothetical protein